MKTLAYYKAQELRARLSAQEAKDPRTQREMKRAAEFAHRRILQIEKALGIGIIDLTVGRHVYRNIDFDGTMSNNPDPTKWNKRLKDD